MIIEGTFIVDAPREAVWPRIANPPGLVPLLPGCEKIEPAAETGTYTVAAQAKVGPIKPKLAGTLKVLEQTPPELMLLRVEGKDAITGSQVRVNVKLTLADRSGATEAAYSADVIISGRLGGLGHGIVRETVGAMLDEFVRRLDAAVKGEPIPDTGLGALSVRAASRAVRDGIASMLKGKDPG
jgi:carbon monoxide dehydrogenase subunit G